MSVKSSIYLITIHPLLQATSLPEKIYCVSHLVGSALFLLIMMSWLVSLSLVLIRKYFPLIALIIIKRIRIICGMSKPWVDSQWSNESDFGSNYKFLHMIYCKSKTISQLHQYLKIKVPSHSKLQGTTQHQQHHLLKIVFFILKLFVISPLFIKPFWCWHLTDLHILFALWQAQIESNGPNGASVLIRTHFWENIKSLNIQTFKLCN